MLIMGGYDQSLNYCEVISLGIFSKMEKNQYFSGNNETVMTVGKSIDAESKTIPVYGKMLEEDKKSFMDGMYIEVEIITQGRLAYGLPNEAIQREEDKYFVFVKKAEEGDRMLFEKLYVNTGHVTEDSTEILTDTEIKDILIKGAFNLAIE